MADAIYQDSGAQAARWFTHLAGVSPEAITRLRASVQSKLEAGACKNAVPIATPELDADYELRACVKRALLEEWDLLSAEERLLICRHPYTQRIGEQVRLPNRGEGTVISQELTTRLSVLVTVRLPNGSLLNWEFYE